jgi:subtilisin family serine protease
MDNSGLEHIVRIRLPIQAIHDVGSVETEGVAVIGADVWQKAGITGKGIKIGVLDVGFDGYKDLLGTDLPSNVVTKSFIGGLEIDNTGVVHGSAVSEIIHDIAPDAELYLADYQTTAEKQAAVDWLMSQNVDIISSSTGSTYGRRDDKGLLAKMVDDVVAQGVLWVNSSGNTGYSHLRGQFTDTNNDGYHEFAPGDQYLGFAPLGSATLALNWNDWDGGTQDLDLHILDSHGDEIASSTDRQSGPGSDAGEFIYYEFPDEGPYYMAIYGYKVTRPVTFDFFLRDGEIEYYTPEYSVNTPGDSMGAITVGAVNWKSGALEDYSSRGPTDDGRIKPELVAPSGVSSAAYGEAWDGTSASCPHVSGAAALIMQAYPDYTIQQVKDYLFSHALDLGKSGEDADTGYGALRLGPPPEITNNQPPPVPTKEVPTPAPTVTPPANPTITPLPTATPVLEDAPKSTGSSSNASLVPLLLLGCVVLPAILGLGGIGVLGAVFVMRRSRPKARPAPKVPQNQDVQKRPAPTASPPPIPGEEEIVCSNCGKHNRPGTRFCSACGTELSAAGRDEVARPIFCTQCGNALRPNAKFCPNCGTPVKKA